LKLNSSGAIGLAFYNEVQLCRALLTTFMFMTAWVFEARHCPTLLNEIKKTKLESTAEPQAGINILLAVVILSPI
jgi:hypothetical protein